MATEDAHDLTALLAATRQADAAAFDRLVGRLRAYCKALARTWLGPDLSQRQADTDVAQNVAVSICQQFPAFRGATAGELVAWVRRSRTAPPSIGNGRTDCRCLIPSARSRRRRSRPRSSCTTRRRSCALPAALEGMPERRRQVVELY